ncbi:phosphoglycerate mutase family protein-like protein [Penicillium cinerascens]|uniref:Phosphoglycerate mutase family protein-like protein n=1 Tax=Penicillium cinerascens TaxID=70096 RepID=A0A9W9MNI0_9EURO|nr:phosphoglycerate mutase family protein-like protein [Penicillium cinerascens]KAJ5204600.1 phosphoglycerate mutase family protein-like protein [Penicillium cinerascens]
MPPTVYVIRHGQGEHNVNEVHHLRDPLLTETGKAQCKKLQEGHLTCDLGYEATITKSEAPNLIAQAAPLYDLKNLDMTLVDETWNSKKGIYAPTLKAVRERAATMRNWIYNRPEKHIALVTHGAFLHYFTEDWTAYEKSRGTVYLNCEYRKLEFTEDSNGHEPHLRECGSMLEKQDRPIGLDAHVIHEIEEVERASM